MPLATPLALCSCCTVALSSLVLCLLHCCLQVSIPVSAIAIGPVHKKDVIRANVMNEKGLKKFGVILAFDVPVSREAREVAQDLGVRIFTADIIYHLFDQFKAYMEEVKKAEKMAARYGDVSHMNEDSGLTPAVWLMCGCVFLRLSRKVERSFWFDQLPVNLQDSECC